MGGHNPTVATNSAVGTFYGIVEKVTQSGSGGGNSAAGSLGGEGGGYISIVTSATVLLDGKFINHNW